MLTFKITLVGGPKRIGEGLEIFLEAASFWTNCIYLTLLRQAVSLVEKDSYTRVFQLTWRSGFHISVPYSRLKWDR